MTIDSDRKAELRKRLLEAAMAILQAVPEKQLNVVVLNKALFYLDLVALRDVGHLVTEGAYLALQNGPVVAKYDRRLVGALEDEGWAEQTTAGMAKPVRVVKPMKAFHHLGADEAKMARAVARGVGRFTSTAASDYSHENPGWQIAYAQGQQRGDGPKLINMAIALQQLADSDPWLDEPLDAEMSRIVDRASDAKIDW